jgi:myo-inositol 2-dehydrogenase / D-chiro-inositol 1-dehydrogenase
MKTETSRRRFIKHCMAAGIAPAFLPAAASARKASSDTVNIGMIGTGRQAIHVNLAAFLSMPEVRVVALCDVDTWRLEEAKKRVDAKYGKNNCKLYRDWREVVARDDIGAIMNSTPDHWHVPISIAAVNAGKHVSCEKPLTLSIAEGRRLADAVAKAGVVFRTDTECRSNHDMRRLTELVRNGYIGSVTHIDVGVPAADKAGGNPAPMPVPEDLDYALWRGPAPWRAYTRDAVHPVRSLGRPGWMRCRDTCEGMITNWGTHVLDVAQHILDTERSGPVSVEARGAYPEKGSGLWDVLLHFDAHFEYASGVTLRYHTDPKGAYVKVTGDEGWIHADWHRKGPGFIASDQRILKVKLKDSDIRFPRRQDKEDFIHAIRTDEPVMIDAETGHRTCSMGQLAHIAINRGKKLAWDPDAERFTNDDEANTMLERTARPESEWSTS